MSKRARNSGKFTILSQYVYKQEDKFTHGCNACNSRSLKMAKKKQTINANHTVPEKIKIQQSTPQLVCNSYRLVPAQLYHIPNMPTP